MTDRGFPSSMRLRTIAALLLGIVFGILVYFGAMNLGGALVEHSWLSPARVRARQVEFVRSFENHISAAGLRSTDTAEMGEWAARHGGFYLAVYRSNAIAFQAGPANAGGAARYGVKQEDFPEPDEGMYPVRFRDGVFAVAVRDYTYIRMLGLSSLISFILACAAVILTNLLLSQSTVTRVLRLSREVRSLGEGNMDAEISLSGRDELAALAADIDAMRRSIISRMESEELAYRSNAELITSISHDVRTPLTTLTGYLDMLAESPSLSEEQRGSYLAVCRDKAGQLKQLTDKLFRYFLVFGPDEAPENMQEYDARILTEQLFGEYSAYLLDEGFTVHARSLDADGSVMVDMGYLKRVFDNIFSNIEKYAERSGAVVMAAFTEDDRLTLIIQNAVNPDTERPEGTKIGLRTCRKLMSLMQGGFETSVEDARFVARMSLPIKIEKNG